MGDNGSKYGSSGNRQVIHNGKQGDEEDIRPEALEATFSYDLPKATSGTNDMSE